MKRLSDKDFLLLGKTFLYSLKYRSDFIVDSSYPMNNLYWMKLTRFGIDDRGISMLNLRYVEYQDDFFRIKPFKKD